MGKNSSNGNGVCRYVRAVRAFCPIKYTVPKSNDAMDTENDIMRKSVFRTAGSTLLKKEKLQEPLRVT